jgi:fructokinase
MQNPMYGAIEAGGTKFVCLVGTGPDNIVAEKRIPTTLPEETLARTIDFFRSFTDRQEISAFGIGSFGPLDLDPHSSEYGFITTTPKAGWRMTDMGGPIRNAFGVPVAIDTDVNAAAYGEQAWVAENRGLDPFLYVTVGTGIGVGAIVNGAPIHGMMHPEGGHLFLPHDVQKDPFPGICPFHGDCWEGLASGPAMAQRWGEPADRLTDDHPAWDLEAEYIALACVNLMVTYSPQRIVLGGGVAQHPGLHAAVRVKVLRMLHGYISVAALLERVEDVIVPPALQNRSGVLGALAMGMAIGTT